MFRPTSLVRGSSRRIMSMRRPRSTLEYQRDQPSLSQPRRLARPAPIPSKGPLIERKRKVRKRLAVTGQVVPYQRTGGSAARPASSVPRKYSRGPVAACYLHADAGLRSTNITKLHRGPCRLQPLVRWLSACAEIGWAMSARSDACQLWLDRSRSGTAWTRHTWHRPASSNASPFPEGSRPQATCCLRRCRDLDLRSSNWRSRGSPA
jgi:hypothetical protein